MIETIIEILGKVKDDSSLIGTLDGSANILDDVGLDSLQLISFFLELENTFDIEIEFEKFDLTKLQSIDSVCKVIEGAVMERQA